MNQFICSSPRILSHLCCRTPSQPATSPRDPSRSTQWCSLSPGVTCTCRGRWTAGSSPGLPGRGRDRRVEAGTAGSRPGLPGRGRDRRVRGRDRRVRGRDRRVEAGTAGSRPGPSGRGRDRRVEAGTAAPGQFGRSLKSDGLHFGDQSMMARPAQRSPTRHLSCTDAR